MAAVYRPLRADPKLLHSTSVRHKRRVIPVVLNRVLIPILNYVVPKEVTVRYFSQAKRDELGIETDACFKRVA